MSVSIWFLGAEDRNRWDREKRQLRRRRQLLRIEWRDGERETRKRWWEKKERESRSDW
jgi:hypothetical protein